MRKFLALALVLLSTPALSGSNDLSVPLTRGIFCEHSTYVELAVDTMMRERVRPAEAIALANVMLEGFCLYGYLAVASSESLYGFSLAGEHFRMVQVVATQYTTIEKIYGEEYLERHDYPAPKTLYGYVWVRSD